MEAIIAWLEANWGVTLFGTVSLGTVITTVIILVKNYIVSKLQGTKLDGILTKFNEVTKELEASRAHSNELQNQLVVKEEYNSKVQAATFKAISYIVAASKLPTEEKIVLQQDFAKLLAEGTRVAQEEANRRIALLQAKAQETRVELDKAAEQIIDKGADLAVDTVKEVVNKTASLISKYTGGE